jgi:hypothetical protein
VPGSIRLSFVLGAACPGNWDRSSGRATLPGRAGLSGASVREVRVAPGRAARSGLSAAAGFGCRTGASARDDRVPRAGRWAFGAFWGFGARFSVSAVTSSGVRIREAPVGSLPRRIGPNRTRFNFRTFMPRDWNMRRTSR